MEGGVSPSSPGKPTSTSTYKTAPTSSCTYETAPTGASPGSPASTPVEGEEAGLVPGTPVEGEEADEVPNKSPFLGRFSFSFPDVDSMITRTRSLGSIVENLPIIGRVFSTSSNNIVQPPDHNHQEEEGVCDSDSSTAEWEHNQLSYPARRVISKRRLSNVKKGLSKGGKWFKNKTYTQAPLTFTTGGNYDMETLGNEEFVNLRFKDTAKMIYSDWRQSAKGKIKLGNDPNYSIG